MPMINGYYDFGYEESLAMAAFKFAHRNYARLETLFMLGEAYDNKKDFVKINSYFNMICNDK